MSKGVYKDKNYISIDKIKVQRYTLPEYDSKHYTERSLKCGIATLEYGNCKLGERAFKEIGLLHNDLISVIKYPSYNLVLMGKVSAEQYLMYGKYIVKSSRAGYSLYFKNESESMYKQGIKSGIYEMIPNFSVNMYGTKWVGFQYMKLVDKVIPDIPTHPFIRIKDDVAYSDFGSMFLTGTINHDVATFNRDPETGKMYLNSRLDKRFTEGERIYIDKLTALCYFNVPKRAVLNGLTDGMYVIDDVRHEPNGTFWGLSRVENGFEYDIPQELHKI